MKKFSALLLFVCLTICSGAQQSWKKQVDSLHSLLAAKGDTNTDPELLFALGYLYRTNNPDSAIYYDRAGGRLCERTKNLDGTFAYYLQIVSVYGMLGNNDSILAYNKAIERLARQLANDEYLALAYLGNASYAESANEMGRALKYYQMAIAIYEKLKRPWNNENQAIAYANILGIYVDVESPERAFNFARKALTFCDTTYQKQVAGDVMGNLCQLYLKANKFDSTLYFADKHYKIAKEFNDKVSMVNALCNMAAANIAMHHLDKAMANASEIEITATEIGATKGISFSTYYMGRYYFELKEFKKAWEYGIRGLSLMDSSHTDPLVLRALHSLLRDASLGMGNIVEFHRESAITDSLINFYQNNKILIFNQQLQAEYNASSREAEIAHLSNEKQLQAMRLNKQKTTNILLICLVAAGGIFSFLVYRNLKQKNKLLTAEATLKKKQITDLEKEKQLTAVQAELFGQEEERKRIANDLHDGLGSILSATRYSFNAFKEGTTVAGESESRFDDSMAMLNKSIHELRRISQNLMPEALLKFGLETALKDFCANLNHNGKITFTLQSYNIESDAIPENVSSTIYRIIQELTNNTLKHAHATQALIQVIMDSGKLTITVEDNGVGFDQNSLDDTTGMGYAILRSRVAYLGGTLDIHSDEHTGTSVTIEIPNVTV